MNDFELYVRTLFLKLEWIQGYPVKGMNHSFNNWCGIGVWAFFESYLFALFHEYRGMYKINQNAENWWARKHIKSDGGDCKTLSESCSGPALYMSTVKSVKSLV